jgi:membrane protein required for beta-lactamase induction
MSARTVIPIGEAALRRAVQHGSAAGAPVVELNRARVGERVLVAERVNAHGRNAWQIRIEGVQSAVEWPEPEAMHATFAALVGTEPSVLEEWLGARAGSAK